VTGALTWARLSFRQQRWELILVALGVALAAIGMLWFASQIDGMRAASPDCLGSASGPGFLSDSTPLTCQAVLNGYSETTGFADMFLYASFAAPFGIGILLGAPLVAREIDGGTAQLAWSLGQSRTWWLLRRIAFVGLFVVAALAVLAVTSEILAAALAPDRNLQTDFTWYGRRGWLIVARGIGALLLGMLIGAIIGRVLPAILAAGIVVVLAFTALSLVGDRISAAEALVRLLHIDDRWVEFSLADLAVDYGLVMPSGDFLTYGELNDRGIVTSWSENGVAYASEADYLADRPVGEEAQRFIPGTRYPEIAARDAAMAGGLGLAALSTAALVVRGRRPV
jgi:hypothetical protein